ncbi:MAG TPA: histidine--tRNA ligase [Gemmatimonadaceae bacterium]|jgi:histidyl-tRNA synthetase|nr:histidine--tRNA ligase [Gemmatimonadaceae bacterium]
MSQGALPGFRDFYPEQLATRNYLMSVWRDVARKYGFVEYDGPPLEPLDLYTRKSGEEIVGQLYNFTDKGGREVALRPEMTPTLARMVAAKANAMRKPIRWFSVPQLFRYERQQKGRLREHFQLNADIIGEASVVADAELLALAIDVMRAVGLTANDVRARVSDRQLLTAILKEVGVKSAETPAVFAAIDKVGREPREVTLEKVEKAVSGDKARKGVARVLERSGDLNALAAEFRGSPEVMQEITHMREYLNFLDALGVGEWVDFDLSIVRGLAYYTGKVFELFDAKGEFRAICGGGRYDDLLKAIGGVDLPALGFGMGDVVLTELLRSRNMLPPAPAGAEYWVAADDETMLPEVMTVAGRLREKSRSVEYALKSQSLARQLKTASTAGVRQVVLLRRDDFANGNVTVKTLADGSERSVALDAYLNSL